VIIDAVRAMAEAKHVPAAQAALAWVYAQAPRLGVPVVPIPGTKRVPWLEQNAAALGVSLSRDDLAALDSLAERVVGGRY
jgi:aryl-alcohol dehydrogenase-like predicted oxidoreductase